MLGMFAGNGSGWLDCVGRGYFMGPNSSAQWLEGVAEDYETAGQGKPLMLSKSRPAEKEATCGNSASNFTKFAANCAAVLAPHAGIVLGYTLLALPVLGPN